MEVKKINKVIIAEILIILAALIFIGTTFVINTFAGCYLLGAFLLLYGISMVWKGGGD
jgi:predicted membrane protein